MMATTSLFFSTLRRKSKVKKSYRFSKPSSSRSQKNCWSCVPTKLARWDSITDIKCFIHSLIICQSSKMQYRKLSKKKGIMFYWLAHPHWTDVKQRKASCNEDFRHWIRKEKGHAWDNMEFRRKKINVQKHGISFSTTFSITSLFFLYKITPKRAALKRTGNKVSIYFFVTTRVIFI